MSCAALLHGAARQHRGAAAGAAALLVLAAGLVACAPDLAAWLWRKWSTSYTYSHGPLIVLTSAWLVWRERQALVATPGRRMSWRILPLVTCSLLWIFCAGAHIDLAVAILLPLSIGCAAYALFGSGAVRALAFPLGIFVSALSVWDILTGPLRHLTSVMARSLVALVGIPAVRTDDLITVPAGTFEVAVGCSGLNFAVTAVTIAALYAYLGGVGRWRAAVLAAIALVLALVANWLRVASVVVAGQLTLMRSPLVEDHYAFGWCLFGGFLLGFFAIAHRLTRSVPPRAAPAPGRGDFPTWPSLALVTACALSGPIVAGGLMRHGVAAAAAAMPALPVARDSWSGPTPAPRGWAPDFAGASRHDRAVYVRDGHAVRVDVAQYLAQHPESKLIGYGSSPDGQSSDRVLGAAVRPTQTRGPGWVRDFIVQRADGSVWRVWQWYQVGSTTVVRPIAEKLLEGLAVFRGATRVAAVSVAVSCAERCRSDAEAQALREFLASHGDALVAAAAGSGVAP